MHLLPSPPSEVSELQGGLESAAGRWALEAAEMRQTARTAQRENQKAVESLTQLAQEAKAPGTSGGGWGGGGRGEAHCLGYLSQKGTGTLC